MGRFEVGVGDGDEEEYLVNTLGSDDDELLVRS